MLCVGVIEGCHISSEEWSCVKQSSSRPDMRCSNSPTSDSILRPHNHELLNAHSNRKPRAGAHRSSTRTTSALWTEVASSIRRASACSVLTSDSSIRRSSSLILVASLVW